MASQHLKRENVEQGKVPKLTTHYEGLVEQMPEGRVQKEAGTRVIGKEEEEREERREAPSLEEIGELRTQAQANSVAAIAAAEERYQKAKGLGLVDDRHAAQKLAEEGKDSISSKGAPMESRQQTISSGAQHADQQAVKAKNTAASLSEKATAAKNTTMDTTKSAAGYVTEKTAAAKDATVDTTKGATGLISEKAAATKDATVEAGKGAAGYAGKVTTGVKDQATVAGWGAAQYTLGMAAEATKKAADMTSNVAGYTGKKALAAKDMAVGAGQSAAGYAGEKLAQVTEAVVAMEENAAEYAARKKAEAEREKNIKASVQEDEAASNWEAKWDDSDTKAPLHEDDEEEGETYYKEISAAGGGGSGGGILKAIGETIMEIGQTTSGLITGDVVQNKEGRMRTKEEPPSYLHKSD